MRKNTIKSHFFCRVSTHSDSTMETRKYFCIIFASLPKSF